MKLPAQPGILLVILAAAAGCGGSGEDVPGFAMVEAAGGAWNFPATSHGGCAEDAEKACTVTYEQSTGTVSCILGVQQCLDGEWSSCMEP